MAMQVRVSLPLRSHQVLLLHLSTAILGALQVPKRRALKWLLKECFEKGEDFILYNYCSVKAAFSESVVQVTDEESRVELALAGMKLTVRERERERGENEKVVVRCVRDSLLRAVMLMDNVLSENATSAF